MLFVVAGISVKEHIEVNVVPLAVCLTAKFYQTMQDFFFPKAEEGASGDTGPDHSYLFGPTGAQRTYICTVLCMSVVQWKWAICSW